ncbi:MAG TPA: UDP-N-acetylglucosamine 2-epimerase [Pyrinomonadaceae bacterium]|jgi:UDP-N-acetylglucosamine 2-epimerase (non-hydrolysing)/GDP/UDP-N,N'-diacetylbacillosamine 2-epimerase (hydrolysing)|nr:UDP-N-acetylglucosamine 2-epimerase [Pyrinomonadaceae bacterium]
MKQKKRRIAAVTTSRADYGHLYWPLRDLSSKPEVDLRILALGPHLSPEFGLTVNEITRDGFTVEEGIECLLSSDTDIGMAKTIGLAALSLADILGRLRPDLLLLIADRYEMLAPAAVALALRIPMAHIEGGEVSEGAIDDAVRNALTKLSHLHFTTTETARRRVLAMGEESWRVHRVGAPSLDHLRRQTLLSCEQVEAELKLKLDQPTIMVAYHPVTLERETTVEADAVFAALEKMPQQIIFSFPNADAGSRALIRRAQEVCRGRLNTHLFINLGSLRYWSLLKEVDLLMGNSSSGIMETASLKKPAVNIGRRQQGREQARNVLNAAPTRDSILECTRRALDTDFLQSLEGLANPYGDGHASERIVEVLTNVELGERLLIKRAVPLKDNWSEDAR